MRLNEIAPEQPRREFSNISNETPTKLLGNADGMAILASEEFPDETRCALMSFAKTRPLDVSAPSFLPILRLIQQPTNRKIPI